jgi:hypothetical protein
VPAGLRPSVSDSDTVVITAVNRPYYTTTVKPLYKDPVYKDNLTNKDATISPSEFLQGDKDNL